jgi:hypothetical protein
MSLADASQEWVAFAAAVGILIVLSVLIRYAAGRRARDAPPFVSKRAIRTTFFAALGLLVVLSATIELSHWNPAPPLAPPHAYQEPWQHDNTTNRADQACYNETVLAETNVTVRHSTFALLLTGRHCIWQSPEFITLYIEHTNGTDVRLWLENFVVKGPGGEGDNYYGTPKWERTNGYLFQTDSNGDVEGSVQFDVSANATSAPTEATITLDEYHNILLGVVPYKQEVIKLDFPLTTMLLSVTDLKPSS